MVRRLTIGSQAKPLSLALVDKDDPHWRYYEYDYDEIALNALVQSRQDEKADKLAAEMEKRAATKQERAGVYLSLGHLYGQVGKMEKAAVNFSKAVDSDAEQCRGISSPRLGIRTRRQTRQGPCRRNRGHSARSERRILALWHGRDMRRERQLRQGHRRV